MEGGYASLRNLFQFEALVVLTQLVNYATFQCAPRCHNWPVSFHPYLGGVHNLWEGRWRFGERVGWGHSLSLVIFWVTPYSIVYISGRDAKIFGSNFKIPYP